MAQRAVVLRDGDPSVQQHRRPGTWARRTVQPDARHGDPGVRCPLPHGPPRTGVGSHRALLYDPARDIVLGHEFVGEVIGFTFWLHRPVPGRHPGHLHPDPVGQRRPTSGGSSAASEVRQFFRCSPKPMSRPSIPAVSPGCRCTDRTRSLSESSTSVWPLRRPGGAMIGAGAIGLSAVRRCTREVSTHHRQWRCRALPAPHSARTSLSTPAERSTVRHASRDPRRARKVGSRSHFRIRRAGLIDRHRRLRRHGHPDPTAGGWYTGDSLDIRRSHPPGVTTIQFGGGPMPQDWYGTLDAIAAGRSTRCPSVG